MNALWRQSPASVREVMTVLPNDNDWAYSTVKTLLTRLTEKGALQASSRGNSKLYTPLISRRDARQADLQAMLARAFDGTFGSLVHHLVDQETLSDKQRAALQELLDQDRDAS